MMENRLTLGWSLVQKNGSFACHIDENEYEESLFSRQAFGDSCWQYHRLGQEKPYAWTEKGIATQHEYGLWFTTLEAPIYLRPENVRKILSKAQEIIKNRGGVNEVRDENLLSGLGTKKD